MIEKLLRKKNPLEKAKYKRQSAEKEMPMTQSYGQIFFFTH